jgi:hypothetical protein
MTVSNLSIKTLSIKTFSIRKRQSDIHHSNTQNKADIVMQLVFMRSVVMLSVAEPFNSRKTYASQ